MRAYKHKFRNIKYFVGHTEYQVKYSDSKTKHTPLNTSDDSNVDLIP